jgi:hypothetical protein
MTESFMIVLVVSAFVLAITFIFRTARKQAELGHQIRQRLGFLSVEPVDPTLVERIAAILDPKEGKIRVSKVYKRDHGAYTLYDCRVVHGSHSDHADQSSVIVGRGWQLPSLRLAPRLGGEGKGWQLLNRLTLLAIKQGGFDQVVLDHQPELAKKYVVLSRRPQEVSRLIPGDVWRGLAACPEQLMLQTDGDTVMFSTLPAPNSRPSGGFETTETDRLKGAIDTASRLNSILNSCRSQVVEEPVHR